MPRRPASATLAPDARLVTPTFVLVTASSLAYFTALGILIPVIPRYVAGPLGGGGVAVGAAVGAFSLSAAALRPFAGRLGDRSGRRVLVVAGSLAVAATTAAYTVVAGVAPLIALRLVSGIGEAAVFVGAATAIQDLAPDDRRGEAASYFSVAIYGGLAAGPAIGEWILDAHGFDAVWLGAAAGALVAAGFGWATPVGRLAPGAVAGPLLHRAALLPGAVLGLALVGFAGFETFVPLYVEDIGLGGAGGVFALYAVLILAVRIFGARLPDRFGPIPTGTAALACFAVGLGTMAAWQTAVGLYAGTAVFAMGMALLFPALLSVVVSRAPEHERSSAVGTFSVFFDLAMGLGAPVLGIAVAWSGEPAAFAAGAGLALTALVVLRGRVAHLPATDVGRVPMPPGGPGA